MQRRSAILTRASLRPSRWPLLVALAAAFFLSGCSTTRIAYTQLDWVTVRYLKAYLPLDQEQERDLRLRVEDLLAWHRTTQLPRYAEFCYELAEAVNHGLSPGYYSARLDELEMFRTNFMQHLAPHAVALLAGLRDEQVEGLLANMEKRNQELAADQVKQSIEQRRRQRERSILRMSSRLVGRLEIEQRALIREHAGRMHEPGNSWLEHRAAWQQALRATLAVREDRVEFERLLVPLLTQPDRAGSDAYRDLAAHNREVISAMLAELADGLSPRQQARLQHRLQGFARDFDHLAAVIE